MRRWGWSLFGFLGANRCPRGATHRLSGTDKALAMRPWRITGVAVMIWRLNSFNTECMVKTVSETIQATVFPEGEPSGKPPRNRLKTAGS